MKIQKRILLALSMFVSRNELRPAMMGIAVQRDKNGVWLVATDGVKLAAYWVDGAEIESGFVFNPSELKHFLKGEGEVELKWVSHEKIEFDFGRTSITIREVNEPYVDWKNVIPKFPGIYTPATIDPREGIVFSRAIRMISKMDTKPVFYSTGEKKAAIVMAPGMDYFFGIIAPYTIEGDRITSDWCMNKIHSNG